MPGIRYPSMINGLPVVTAPAEIDVTTAEKLQTVLAEAAANGHAVIVVDLTGTRQLEGLQETRRPRRSSSPPRNYKGSMTPPSSSIERAEPGAQPTDDQPHRAISVPLATVIPGQQRLPAAT